MTPGVPKSLTRSGPTAKITRPPIGLCISQSLRSVRWELSVRSMSTIVYLAGFARGRVRHAYDCVSNIPANWRPMSPARSRESETMESRSWRMWNTRPPSVGFASVRCRLGLCWLTTLQNFSVDFREARERMHCPRQTQIKTRATRTDSTSDPVRGLVPAVFARSLVDERSQSANPFEARTHVNRVSVDLERVDLRAA